MVNRLLAMALACILASAVSADPITEDAAGKVAKKVLRHLRNADVGIEKVDVANKVGSRASVVSDGEPEYYVYNSEDGRGYVIVSGDDLFPEVVGYSDEGHLGGSESLPPALSLFLDSYGEYVDDVRSGKAESPQYEYAAAAGAGGVGEYMCTAQWGQGSPFNWYCPSINNIKCPTGCVATAMAQLMRYWEFPESARGSVLYNTKTKAGILKEDLSTSDHVYKWDKMLDTYSSSTLPANRNPMAQLMYDCGLGSKMQYDTDASGAYLTDAGRALYTYFRYDASTLRIVDREYFATASEWHSLLVGEIKDGRPILMAAASTKGTGGDAAGHAFVIDGYDSEGFVHVNWGWSGYDNGFFDLALLDVSPYEFSKNQSALIGIQPGTGDEEKKPARLYMADNLSLSTSVGTKGRNFNVVLSQISNLGLEDGEWYVSAALYTTDGEFVTLVTGSSRYDVSLEQNYGENNFTMLCNVPTSVSGGDYVLRIVCREKDRSEWTLPYTVGGDDANGVPVYIVGSELRFNQVSAAIEGLDMANESGIKFVETFRVNGEKVSERGATGLVIERQTMNDGTVRSVKKYRK